MAKLFKDALEAIIKQYRNASATHADETFAVRRYYTGQNTLFMNN